VTDASSGSSQLLQLRALSQDAAFVATKLGSPVLEPHLHHSNAALLTALVVYTDMPVFVIILV